MLAGVLISRRRLISTTRLLLAASIATFASGCRSGDQRDGSAGSSSSSGSGAAGNEPEGGGATPGATLVSMTPKGNVRWTKVVVEYANSTTESDDEAAQTAGFASTSNLVLLNGLVYLGAGEEVRAHDAQDGRLVHRKPLKGAIGAAAITVAGGNGTEGDQVLVACTDGSLYALEAVDLDVLWKSVCVQASSMIGSETTRFPNGSEEVHRTYADANWHVTNIACRGNRAYVGFSSYQVDPGSHLICISLDDGSPVWTLPYPGRFASTDGQSELFASDAGLVVPEPEATGVLLLDYESGAEIARIEIDSPLGTGLTTAPEDATRLFALSRQGTLYRLRAKPGSLNIEDAVALSAVPEAGIAQTIPSEARPVLFDGCLLCNLARAKDAEDASIALVDANTLQVIDTVQNFSLDTTPIVLQCRDDPARLLVICLGTDGLWQASYESRHVGAFKRINDDVSCGKTAWDTFVPVDSQGTLYLASGNSNRQRLFAIS
ncbi:PQQ-binding-like beta-propeller repeat protein [Coriobacterium glomerans]|uniref:outer membrane protein assembly factor BamB family protein n=1 Tax=Coriobacterium glomerans TaxID=33871 RepID=UPI000309091A|nr:PQQ-binding-like beta-propeller repeat protein [Coriobacterium glomerans]